MHSIPFYCLSNFTRLYSIKLPDHQSFERLIENSNHLVCGLFVDVAKPILDIQTHHLLHHAFMRDASWITIGVVVTSSLRVV